MKVRFTNLKRRGGCQFIDIGTETDHAFCFSAARTWGKEKYRGLRGKSSAAAPFQADRAAEKQKDKGVGRAPAINRQPLRGLETGASRLLVKATLLGGFAIFLFAHADLAASTNDLATALQKGLFEEEANHNYAAAIEAYQGVINRFDEDRKLAATAIFRVGEIYRKQGKTNEANVQYERIAHEFSDQSTLATLSQSYLATANISSKNDAAANLSVESAPTSDETEQVKKIRAMIRDSPDLINAKDFPGNTPLHRAADLGQFVVTRFLVENGADVNIRNGAGETPLYIAAKRGHKAIVELLLDRKASVQTADANGSTSLHAAAQQGFRTIVEVLLAHGAEVNAKTKSGSTPLHLAVASGFKSVAEVLISHGADVNANAPGSEFNGTPLHIAAGRDDQAIAELLLANKANPNPTNLGGYTSLHIAASRGNEKLMKLLLENKANVDAIDSLGETPLDLAAKGDHTNAAETLLAHGAEVNARNPLEGGYKDWTPLHYAASGRHNETAVLLLKHGADPNASITADGSGWAKGTTPLIMAAINGETDIVAALLDSKADPNTRDATGLSPLFAAMRVQDSGPTPTGLPMATPGLPTRTLPGVLPTTAPISAVDKRKQIISLLLDHGADIEAESEQHKTPLMLACDRKDKVVVDLLLSHKASVNAKNPKGTTALHFAVLSLFDGINLEAARDIIEALLAAGANVNLQSNDGITALNYLLNSGRPIPFNSGPTRSKIEQLLREHGAVTDLPRLDAIEVRRPAANYSRVIFTKGTNGWDQFTLFELIGGQYKLVTASDPGGRSWYRNATFNPQTGLEFPDFGHIRIRHPKADFKSWNERSVDISAALASGDCSADVPLAPGDQVEIPEADHILHAGWDGLSMSTLATLKKCLSRQITIVIKGQTNNITLAPDYTTNFNAGVFDSDGRSVAVSPQVRIDAPFMIRPALNESHLLLASSDLSRIKLIRTDPVSGQRRELIVDCRGIAPGPSVWLRDGDVIEVPDKP